jgi:predicted N-acyltransferase
MDINFDSFDDFLRTMSQSSKDNLKRNLKKSANVAIKLEIVSCLEDELVPDVHRLYLETINGKENSFEVLTPEFFENISRNMPQETKYFLWRVDGKLAAFALCLVKNSHFQDHYLGFDYSIAYKYGLYFVRFRDLMKWCIANDIKKYEMGVAGYEAKRRLGFHFLRYYFYMKHRNKIMNFFFALLSPYLGPANFNPIFKYLKENNKKYVVEPSE